MKNKGPIYQMVDEELAKTRFKAYEAHEIDLMFFEIMKKIQELEPVWIPAYKRFPETSYDVIIVHQGETKIGYCINTTWYDAFSHHILVDVRLWQPLPLPPTK